MAPVTFFGVCTYCGLILCLLTVLLVEKVNSSATCQEKYLDGQTPDTKHIVTVGEKITLKCDLSAVNVTTDVVYWKNDEAVMSEDGGVIPKFQSKFNVSYGKNAKGILLYTISWIAELDDAGSYNCTCSTGGIRFRVWIRRPCNTVDNVLSNGTSVEVLDFLSNNTRVKDVAYKDSFNFSIALDCNCTWPEVNRTFNGVWYTNDTDTASVCGSGCTEIEDVQMANITGYQDTSLTPIGCYTGKGSVTYRYRNVFGSIHPNITCTPEMMNRVYNFYINEAQSTKQRTLMKIRCGGCTNDSSVSATSYVCMITGPIMGCCLVGMIILIVILRCWDKIDCCCISQETCPAPPDPKKIATAAVKKVLIAKIVFGICLGTGAVCLIALLVQSVSDSKCKIPSSRACACAKCECALPQSDLIAASCVGVLTGGVIIVSSIFLAKVFLPRRPKKAKPESRPPSTNPPLSHTQVYPCLEDKEKSQIENETDTETTPRKKKQSALRNRQNKVDPVPSGDDDVKEMQPSWDDNERTFANGHSVPVSGSTAGQLSYMTPERHPRTKLDPIITVPEGGDPPVDGNGESPRKKHKKRKKRHHRSLPQPQVGGNTVEAGPNEVFSEESPGLRPGKGPSETADR